MARRIRWIPPDSLVEISSKTVEDRFLMKPTRDVRRTVLGVLGRAQRIFEVQIVAFVFLSNHYHILGVFSDARHMAAFVGYLNGNLSRKLGRLLRRKGPFWSSRYHYSVVSEEEEAQIERLRYLLSQGCKEGLVGAPQDWPGAQCVKQLCRSETELYGVWKDTENYNKARRRGKRPLRLDYSIKERVVLSPLPCWRARASEDTRAQIHGMVEEIISETKAMHRGAGTSPIGRKRLLQLDVQDHSRSQPKRRPLPLIHAASRQVRLQYRELFRAITQAYRVASARWRSGVLDAVFPPGCFRPDGGFVSLHPLTAPG